MILAMLVSIHSMFIREIPLVVLVPKISVTSFMETALRVLKLCGISESYFWIFYSFLCSLCS